MKTIAIYSNKGGTAKTTTVFNVAGILARDYKKKVLVVDLDTQANITGILLRSQTEERGDLSFLNARDGVEDVFLNPDKVNDAIIPSMFSLTEGGTPKKRGIDVIPARKKHLNVKQTLDDINTGIELKAIPRGQLRTALSRIRRTRGHLYDYDYCLIDFGPASNAITEEGLAASDYCMLLTTLDGPSLSGFDGAYALISKVQKEYNAALKLLGIVPTLCNEHLSYDAQVLEYLKGNDKIINAPIRESTDAKWATEFGIPLAFNKRSANVTRDYRHLTEIILNKMGV